MLLCLSAGKGPTGSDYPVSVRVEICIYTESDVKRDCNMRCMCEGEPSCTYIYIYVYNML